MIFIMRPLWACSLWIGWALDSAWLLGAFAAFNVLVLAMVESIKPRELVEPLLAAIIIGSQVFLLGLVAGWLDLPQSRLLEHAVLMSARTLIVLLAWPLLSRGTLLDDLMILCARILVPRRSASGWKLANIGPSTVLAVAAAAMPLLSIPVHLRDVRRAQILRGQLPSTGFGRLRLLWRHPLRFVWELHVEPLIVRSIQAIPSYADALALKGYLLEIPPLGTSWSWDRRALGCLLGVSLNVAAFFV